MQGEADVEFAGDDAAGNVHAEEFARHDGHIRAVVRDRRQQRSERFEAGRRGIAEAHGSGDARAGEAGALGGALERRERERCLREERLPGGGEPDLAVVADEQLCPKGALELVDLVAQRRLGDVETRGCTAEVALLRNGEEVAKQARFEVDSPRLSVARDTGLGQHASPPPSVS